MAQKKRIRRIVIAAVIVVVLLLILPVSNLVVALPHSERLAALVGGEGQLAEAGRIMQGKCGHCHTPDAGLPFYAALPGAGGAIQHDVEVGLRHLDLAEELIAESKAPAEVALAKIEYAAKHRSMPPTRYLALHWNASLSGDERQTLLTWAAETRASLYAASDLPEELRRSAIRPLPQTHAEKPQRVALGNTLFHDKRLSKDDSLSCASCHGLDKGGTDQEAVATGVGDAKGPINSPTVFNALFNVKQFWDGRAVDLKDQAAGPVTNPIEMAAEWEKVVEKLNADAALKEAFTKEYPEGFSKDTITDAIAAFECTLLTPNGRFDKFLRGDDAALTAEEKDGFHTFEDLGCATCHCGPALGGQSFEPMGRRADYFAERGDVKEADFGRFNATKKEPDRHRFKVPVLRNIALTFPYFHDAGAKELPTAVRIMALVQHGRELSDAEAAKIAAFLKTLTGEYEGKPL